MAAVQKKLINQALTAEEVAEWLRVYSSMVYQLLRKRRIQAFSLGADWCFIQASIASWIKQREAGSGAARVMR